MDMCSRALERVLRTGWNLKSNSQPGSRRCVFSNELKPLGDNWKKSDRASGGCLPGSTAFFELLNPCRWAMRWLMDNCSRSRRSYEAISEIIREHGEEQIADLMDDGLRQDEAERAARREFCNVPRIDPINALRGQ